MFGRLSSTVVRPTTALPLVILCFSVWSLVSCGNRRPETLRIGCEHIEPNCVFGADGEPKGLMPDVMKEAAARRGFSLKWVRETEGADAALQQHLVDFWPTLGRSPAREKTIAITNPWLDEDIVLLSATEAGTEHSDKSFLSALPSDILHAGTPALADFAAKHFPSARRIRRPSKAAVIESLCRGEARAALMDDTYLHAMLLRRPSSCEKVNFKATPIKSGSLALGIASNKEKASAAESLFIGIRDMAADGTLERLISKRRPFSGARAFAALKADSVEVHNRDLSSLAFVLFALSFGLLFQIHRIRAIDKRLRLNSERLAEQLCQRQAAEERFRVLFDHGSEPRLILNPAGTIVDCNLASMALVRAVNKSELIGKHPSEFAPEFQPDGRSSSKIASDAYSTAVTKGICRFDWWRYDRHHNLFPVEITIVPVQLEGKLMFLSSLHDLSRSKRTEEALLHARATLERRVEERTRELKVLNQALADEVLERTAAVQSLKQRKAELYRSEQQYRFLAESIPQLLFTATPDGNPDYYNQHFCDYTGLDLGDCQGGNWRNFIYPEDRECSGQLWERSILTGQPYESELRMKSATGTYRWFLARAIPMCDAEGRIVKWFGTCTDIDDRKEAERLMHLHQQELEAQVDQRTQQLMEQTKRAEQASRAKSEFLARMSHEIRTPMYSILGVSELLWESELNTEQRDLVRLFCQNGNRLLNIVNDILDLSKVESGVLELTNEPFSLRDTVFEVSELLSKGVLKQDLTLDVQFDSSLPRTVCGDQLRLRQVLTNLLGNAFKFTDTGKVRLTVMAMTRQDRPFAQFSVIDTGPGIPAHAHQDVFEAFNQGDTSVTRRHGGTGLGLAIAKQLVEQMGGEMGLASNVGEGSTFWFTFPCTQIGTREAAHKRMIAVAVEPPTTVGEAAGLVKSTTTKPELDRNARVLVVDDSPENILLMRMFTQRENVDLDIATNGHDAIELVLTGRYDLVFMDIRMPVLDGRTATRAIRKAEQEQGLAPTPILALSADALPDEIVHSIDAGCNEHLTKPIKRSRVLEAIAKWTSWDKRPVLQSSSLPVS